MRCAVQNSKLWVYIIGSLSVFLPKQSSRLTAQSDSRAQIYYNTTPHRHEDSRAMDVAMDLMIRWSTTARTIEEYPPWSSWGQFGNFGVFFWNIAWWIVTRMV